VSTPAVAAQGLDDHAPQGQVETTAPSGVGSTVEAEDLATGLRLKYRLVEPHDANPKEGLISIVSPVGLVLRARRRGEVVTATTPRGHRRLRIIHVA
jgi:transcription elongation GreA/GreB family factor